MPGLPPEIKVYPVHHLPIIKAYADQLGLVSLINHYVPTEMGVDAGTVVLAMVLDTLSGRSPLYRLEEFFAQHAYSTDVCHPVHGKVGSWPLLVNIEGVGRFQLTSAPTLARFPRFPLYFNRIDTMLVRWFPQRAAVGKLLTFPYRDFSEYTCGLADGPP